MNKVCVECRKEYEVDETDKKQLRSIVCSKECQKMYSYKMNFNKTKTESTLAMERAGMKFEFQKNYAGRCGCLISGTLKQYIDC